MVKLLDAVVAKPRKFKPNAAALRAVRDNLVQELQELERRAHGCGLHVTAHALNRAKNAAGWEIAGNVEEAGRASRDKRG